MKTPKIVVETGANPGLGLESSRQLPRKGYKVIITNRDRNKGQLPPKNYKRKVWMRSTIPLKASATLQF